MSTSTKCLLAMTVAFIVLFSSHAALAQGVQGVEPYLTGKPNVFGMRNTNDVPVVVTVKYLQYYNGKHHFHTVRIAARRNCEHKPPFIWLEARIIKVRFVMNAKRTHLASNTMRSAGGADACTPVGALTDQARCTRQFTAYAGPLTWGPWVTVASHGGRFRYSISASPIGNTQLTGQVRYQGKNGQVTSTFFGSTTIQTGNAWANVKVRFKGIPTGSAVRVTINP